MLFDNEIIKNLDIDGIHIWRSGTYNTSNLLTNAIKTMLSRVYKNPNTGIETVDYYNLKLDVDNFISNIIPYNISESNIQNNVKYCKFRYSNNNNSDAITFHRDDKLFGTNLEQKTFDISSNLFTCIVYFDDTYFEYYKGSHRWPTLSIAEACKRFGNFQSTKINIGDIVLISPMILHKGTFLENLKNRRVLQIFDISSNFDEIINKTLVIQSQKTNESIYDPLLKKIGHSSIFNNISNFFSYIYNICTPRPYSLKNNNNIKYISSDGFCKRYYYDKEIKPNNHLSLNIYIVVNSEHTCNELNINENILRFELFYLIIIYLIIIIIIVIIIICILISIIVKTLKNKRNKRNKRKRNKL